MQIVENRKLRGIRGEGWYARVVTTTSYIPAQQLADALLGPMRSACMQQLRRGFGPGSRGEADTHDLHAITVQQIQQLVDEQKITGKLSRPQIAALVRRVGRFQTLKLVHRFAKNRGAEAAYTQQRASSTPPNYGIEIEFRPVDLEIASMRARGMRTTEIASRMGMTETAVTTRLARMRERLSDELR